MSNSNVGATVPFEEVQYQVEQLQADGTWQQLASVGGKSIAFAKFREVYAGNPEVHVRVQGPNGVTVVTTLLPEYQLLDDIARSDGQVMWSGLIAPPKVGDMAKARFNNHGEGVVAGYYVEGGYLGVKLSFNPETAPDWFKKQNPDNNPVSAFGAELATPYTLPSE